MKVRSIYRGGIVAVALALAVCEGHAGVAPDSNTPNIQNRTYAMIVGGLNKDPQELAAKDRAVKSLRQYLADHGRIPPDRMAVLVAGNSKVTEANGESGAESLKTRTSALATVIRPTDRFIFYYVGQANVAGDSLRLNLPGPDVTTEQLAEWLSPIQAASMLLVFDCPGAQLAATKLSRQGRVILCAASAKEHNSTRFSEYFVQALTGVAGDGDGKVSVLEAFTEAVKQMAEWYQQQQLIQTETPSLEDNGDGVPSRQPWRHGVDLSAGAENADGLAASSFFIAGES